MSRAKRNKARRPQPRPTPVGKAGKAGLPSHHGSGSKLRKALSSAAWQGIAAILTLGSIGVSIWLYYDNERIQGHLEDLQKQATIANVTLTTTYLYEGADDWTMNVDVSNNGPAVANTVLISYSALHTTCMLDELVFKAGRRTRVITRSIKSDLQCPDGSALTAAKPITAVPGIFVHPLASTDTSPSFGLFSGTSYSVHPDQDVIVDLTFKVSSGLNKKLMAELPATPLGPTQSSPSKVKALFYQFKQVTIAGDNVRLTASRYSAEM